MQERAEVTVESLARIRTEDVLAAVIDSLRGTIKGNHAVINFTCAGLST
jgi:hypothetical protein